jgi:cell wall-associated NlpC family hydrolase
VQPVRPATAPTVQALLRGVCVLLACLGLAGVTLAAAGGSKAGRDPGAAVVAAARAHLGDTYTWAATGPDTWDCSGLTSTLWRQVGGVKDIPRTSRQQQAWAVPLPAEQVVAGDLVFFGDPVTHVGIVTSRTTTSTGTVVRMVDASASHKGVGERQVWKTATIRYGRVPRAGMLPVAPWTPPARPVPTTTQTSAATPTPTKATPSRATPSKATEPPAASPHSKPGMTALPKTQKLPSSPVARKAVALAKAALGNTRLTDVELVRNVWRRAGGATLPESRKGLTSAARTVPAADLRVGDLVVYAAPAAHVGIYAGNGMMVDASRALGKVVLRQVWAAPGRQFLRLSS